MRWIGTNLSYRIIFLIFMVSAIVSCSPCKQIVQNDDGQEDSSNVNYLANRIAVKKVDCWANLMPNSGNKIYLRGEIEIINLPDSDNFTLSHIRILQQGKECYRFVPGNVGEATAGITNGIIYFSEPERGLEISGDIDLDKDIDVVLLFAQNSNQYEFIINNIVVEKTY